MHVAEVEDAVASFVERIGVLSAHCRRTERPVRHSVRRHGHVEHEHLRENAPAIASDTLVVAPSARGDETGRRLFATQNEAAEHERGGGDEKQPNIVVRYNGEVCRGQLSG